MQHMWEKIKMNLITYFSTDRVLDYIWIAFKIVAIIVATRLVLRFARFFFERIFKEPTFKGISYNPKRVQTLKFLALSALRYVIYFLAVTMILEEFNFPVTSLLAGAGIFGLAIGFGAQNLVKDIITGFFILLENQFSVGEHVRIDTIEGVVQEIGLRTTRIKDYEGQVHIIPNGQISIVTNYSATDSIRVMFDVAIPYGEDVDRTIALLEAACQDFAAQNDKVVGVPQVLGLQTLGESSYTVRIYGRALPEEQWGVERALKLKVKTVLDEAGVDVPYPKYVSVMHPGRIKDRDGGKSGGTA